MASKERTNSATSSIEDAVQELLSMTNAAVKKLTETNPKRGTVGFPSDETSIESSASSSTKIPYAQPEDLTPYQADKRLLEILSETRQTHHEGGEQSDRDENEEEGSHPVDSKSAGKIVDVISVLEEMPRSEISIMEVGGGQSDMMSSISTPSHLSQEVTKNSDGRDEGENIPDAQSFKDCVAGLPGDSILSPIPLPRDTARDECNAEEQEESVSVPQVQKDGHKNLTSSTKSKPSPQPDSPHSSSGNSSTASEVLRQSTRAPKIPDYAKINPKIRELNASDGAALNEVKMPQNLESSGQPTTQIIIRKSNHVPQRDETSTSGLKGPGKQRVRLPRKRLKEVKSPHERQLMNGKTSVMNARRQVTHATGTYQPLGTLAQGVAVSDKENKDGEVDSDLKIIRGSKDFAKMKLLEAKGSRVSKRVIQANIIEEKLPTRKSAQDDFSTMLTTAMASAAPMLQVKQDLESQVKRLTDKLDEVEKQKKLEETNKHQERVKDLEKKLEELTTQRLHSLEQLQEQQAAWQSHLLRVIGNMQISQSQLSTAAKKVHSLTAANARLDGIPENPDVLQTPAPRTQAPHPIASKAAPKGTSPGNAYLLKNILDQMDVSTPGPSPAIPAHMKHLRDPLADVTPVRGPTGTTQPKGINMTSTPQAELNARNNALLLAKKEAEEEAERQEILRKFPASISVYLNKDPTPQSNVTRILPESKIPSFQREKQQETSLEQIRRHLDDLHNRRTILNQNLAKIERDRSSNDIAAKINYEILAEHPDANPDEVEKLRIRKMVDDQIKALKDQTEDVSSRDRFGRDVSRQKNALKMGRRGQLPVARGGARIDTGLRKKQPFSTKSKPGDKKTSNKPPVQRGKSSPGVPDLPVCPDTEDFVTHVYGKAAYHPRRTTVHNPYLHINTPIKKPKFRKKEAVEYVEPLWVKSAKTQTSPPPTATVDQSQYYFSPSISPVRPPLSVSPTPGQLIPMAIPLGAPRITDGVETVPIILPPQGPMYTTYSPLPERTIRIYDPDIGGTKGPNTAVISVKGEDGPDLAVQKLDNIDIDTPDVTEAAGVQSLHPPVHDELPGAAIPFKHDKDESEGTNGSLHIELRGGAGSDAPVDYHGPSFPPVAPPDRYLSAGDVADEIDKHELEQETMRWVEQEILARILSELHPPGSQRIQDSGPVQERDSSEPTNVGEPVLLNPEGLQLFIDAGLPIDEATVNRLVEEELTKILREMIKRPAQDQTVPKTPAAPPRSSVVTHAPGYRIPTPLPTPEPSPASSISEKPKTHLHTPSLTPESSMTESLPPREPSPVTSPEPQPPTPKALSPPKTPEEVTLVQTPEATPPSTPTPEPRLPGTPTMSQASKSPPITPKQEYPDPWGGAEFPLPEELHMKQKGPSAMTFAPPPDAVDLVVRAVTPPPATPPDRSLSEPDTSTTTSSDRGESSISEGQLVISHGEVRAKMKRGQLPGIIEEIFGDKEVQQSMALQSTLRDANDIQDYDPYSDGEIRLSVRPAMISRVAGYHAGKQRPREYPPGDDPAGVYSRPRHPLPSDDDDDELSVGEVKPQTIADRRHKFRKWREERSPKYASGSSFGYIAKKRAKAKEVDETLLPDSPLSMDDLQRRDKSPGKSESESGRSTALSETDENLGGNVIVVTPAASKQAPVKSQASGQPQTMGTVRAMEKPAETLVSEDFQRVMASTDHSGVIKDSLEDSMRKKDDIDQFFDDGKDSAPAQPALKVSLTLPTAEPVVSVSSEPVTDADDVSEISAAGF